MHDGQMLESGTHAELLAAQGRYAKGWAMGALTVASPPVA